MNAEPDLARIAATVGDPRRIQMLALLMEGRALTAKELALGAGVEPATATAHLKRLLEDGLLESASQGRHKYFRFASEHVAQLVESLMRVAPPRKAARAAHSEEPIRAAPKGEKAVAQLGLDIDSARERRRQFACRCLDWSERQDHLGGALGAALAEHFKSARWIEQQKHSRVVRLTPLGQESLLSMGLRPAG